MCNSIAAWLPDNKKRVVDNFGRAINLPAIIASVPAPEPIAYLIERHVFRASQDGQDAEGLDWLEVAEIGDAGSFPVYAAPPAAEINRQLLEASKGVVRLLKAAGFLMQGTASTPFMEAIAAAEKEMGK